MESTHLLRHPAQDTVEIKRFCAATETACNGFIQKIIGDGRYMVSIWGYLKWYMVNIPLNS